MNIRHAMHHLSVDGAVDKDGDLLIRTTSSGLFLTPAEQDQLIQHLIEVRGAGRVQELLNGTWDGAERRAVSDRTNWFDLKTS